GAGWCRSDPGEHPPCGGNLRGGPTGLWYRSWRKGWVDSGGFHRTEAAIEGSESQRHVRSGHRCRLSHSWCCEYVNAREDHSYLYHSQSWRLMRAVIYTGAGGPEVISLGEVPNPEVKPGHIRVRVHAAGLNRADLSQRRGNYPAPKGWPANIPGLEYAGDVEAVRGVSRWKVGDRVMGLVGGGAQA